jgi:transposase
MAKRKVHFPLVHPHAAGIDIGSRSHFVCLGKQADQVQEFSVFTEDLHRMAKWLKANHVTTIAMESTGFYWKSLFLLLQDYGFEVILVNAVQTKNVRGKKSDVLDCQWIYQLHTAGLLPASYQPDPFTEELRTYCRHRKSLIEGASRYISKMQKALVVMNIHLPVVLTDIVGKSGTSIIKAILNGERDGKKLASLAHNRVKASKEKIAKALTGHWQEQHLFELQECYNIFQYFQERISLCDEKIDEILANKVQENGQHDLVYETPPKKRSPARNQPKFEINKYIYQLTDGVDLTQIEGVAESTILTLISEVGLDLSKFPTAKHFASWLGLAPNKKVSGGKVLSSKTPKNKGRLSVAFRQAANAAGLQKDTSMSYFFRKMAYRKGRKAAITATARKLSIIVYNMLTKKIDYQPLDIKDYEQQRRNQKIKHLQNTINKLGLKQDELVFT